ncbi:MAG: 16S rRNA processing protein RimM [Anaerolineaceae bacterium]|nr:16S rRNA processing protein RimM [Anaerolineaceae bacterium]
MLIGRLQRVHGVDGEIAMRVLTDFPQRIRHGKQVFVGEDHQQMIIESVRPKAELLLLTFKGITTREAAQELTNLEVFVEARNLPKLPEGKYYHHQILGLQVYEGEELLGYISEIIETGANDVFAVRLTRGGELLIPNIPEVVLAVELEEKRMLVHLLEGLRG